MGGGIRFFKMRIEFAQLNIKMAFYRGFLMDKSRRSGILMPISALPNKYGIGTLGDCSKKFIDFLRQSGVSVWQTLPLLPTNYGDSPYQSCDSNALNYYFIDFDLLREDGLLSIEDYSGEDWGDDPQRVDYGKLFLHKARILRIAFDRFNKTNAEWLAFLESGKYNDFATFMAIKCRYNHLPWTEWGEYSDFNEELVARFVAENVDDVNFWIFTQYIFLKQWKELKQYARKNNVEIMGDMPIYVAYDSVEMWKYGKELFMLDKNGNPALVAGVPPDAFSDDGQLWGNPVYDWQRMKLNGYKWWHDRIDYSLELFDIVRIDHFRGFDRFYAIPNGSKNAKVGEWMQGPSADLFVGREHCNIVAEDLGVIDDGVITMMRKTGYPGMKVLEFAFDGNSDNEHKPTNCTYNFVAYTGTHDNQPLCGYIKDLNGKYDKAFTEDLKKECKSLGVHYKGKTVEDKCKTVIKLLFACNAFMVVVPMQDLLCMGDYARMNFPSTVSPDNWSFRFYNKHFSKKNARWLSKLVKKTLRNTSVN